MDAPIVFSAICGDSWEPDGSKSDFGTDGMFSLVYPDVRAESDAADVDVSSRADGNTKAKASVSIAALGTSPGRTII